MARSNAKLALAIVNHVKKNWSPPVSNSESLPFEVTYNLAALEGRSSTQVSLKTRLLIAPDAVVRRKHDTDGVGSESPSGNDESGLS